MPFHVISFRVFVALISILALSRHSVSDTVVVDSLVIATSKETSITVPGESLNLDFNARYDAALQLFQSGQYAVAVLAYQDLLLAEDLRPTYADNCYFWMGESYYAQKLWLDASACFFKVLEFPWPNKEEDARMKLALSWFNLGDRPRACAEISSLLNLFPQTRFQKRAAKLQTLACSK